MIHLSRSLWLPAMFVSLTCTAQRYEMKKQITEKNSAPLLKMADDLFTQQGNLSFNISTNDTRASYDEIPDATLYDAAYLYANMNALKKDSVDPVAWYNVGQYYLNNGGHKTAGHYLTKALTSLRLDYFSGDSSRYYQMSGFIKTAMGDATYISDFKKAIALNPNDSVSTMFYIIALFQSGQYDEMRAHCVTHLEKGTGMAEVSYVMLICADILGTASLKIDEIDKNEKLKPTYRKKDYNQFFDFTLIEKYYQKYKHDKHFEVARNYADILAMLFKLAVMEQTPDKMTFKLQYTKNDVKRLKELETWLQTEKLQKGINPYSVNKALGFVYFMLNDAKKAYAFFYEATRLFPHNKTTSFFHPTECYEALIYTSKLVKADEKEFLDIIETKISLGDSIQKSIDCINLALYYFVNKNMDKAWQWCTQSGMYNPQNTEALMLYAHLCYRKKDLANAEHHISEAMKYLATYDQQKRVCIQTAIYFLLNNDATNAYGYIRIAEKSLDGQACDECIKLIDQYITIIPQ